MPAAIQSSSHCSSTDVVLWCVSCSLMPVQPARARFLTARRRRQPTSAHAPAPASAPRVDSARCAVEARAEGGGGNHGRDRQPRRGSMFTRTSTLAAAALAAVAVLVATGLVGASSLTGRGRAPAPLGAPCGGRRARPADGGRDPDDVHRDRAQQDARAGDVLPAREARRAGEGAGGLVATQAVRAACVRERVRPGRERAVRGGRRPEDEGAPVVDAAARARSRPCISASTRRRTRSSTPTRRSSRRCATAASIRRTSTSTCGRRATGRPRPRRAHGCCGCSPSTAARCRTRTTARSRAWS